MDFYFACAVCFGLGALTPVVIRAATAVWRLHSELKRDLQSQP